MEPRGLFLVVTERFERRETLGVRCLSDEYDGEVGNRRCGELNFAAM